MWWVPSLRKDVDLLRFKYIPHKLLHDSFLARFRFYESLIYSKQFIGNCMIYIYIYMYMQSVFNSEKKCKAIFCQNYN